jgi:hypothetical protein
MGLVIVVVTIARQVIASLMFTVASANIVLEIMSGENFGQAVVETVNEIRDTF